MIYSFSLISLIIIVQHFSISNASPSVENNMLISFMKGHQEMQISKYSIQKYEAHLGIMYFMRKNWQCDKIAEEFEEYERTECQKYRKYLDILYEYLYREYTGIPTVKPKFIFKKEIEIEGPLIYAVNCLVEISKFYFKSGEYFAYKLYNLNKDGYFQYFVLKLLNEERLNFGIKLENEPKLPINEIILQLAIETANECQTNESLEGIIRQNFDNKLEEMYKKAEERAKEYGPWSVDEINDDKHKIIVKFDDKFIWTVDALFSEFVKGFATNFEKFFKMAKEYSNFVEFEQMKKYLTQRYEALLRIVYLLRENWHCANIGNEFEEYQRTECQKYRKYLDILYEYLFRLYAEAKDPKVSKQLSPLVKPIFMDGNSPYFLSLIVKRLNEISKYFWEKEEKVYGFWNINLVNEEELNYEIKEEKHWFDKNKQLNGPTDIQSIWEQFEQKMGEIAENAKENA